MPSVYCQAVNSLERRPTTLAALPVLSRRSRAEGWGGFSYYRRLQRWRECYNNFSEINHAIMDYADRITPSG